MIYLIYFSLGLIVGSIVMTILKIKSMVGILRIDHSDPEKDTYRIEINNLGGLSKKKYISLRVDNHANLSQK